MGFAKSSHNRLIPSKRTFKTFSKTWDPDVVERAHRVCLGDGRGQVRVDAERLVRGHVGARRVLHAAEAALLPNARRVPAMNQRLVLVGVPRARDCGLTSDFGGGCLRWRQS